MNDIFDTMTMSMTEKPTFIFVDGSYYCFYRYYALVQWWKNAHADEPLVVPYENEIFVEKFKRIFIDNLQNIHKKINIPKTEKPILIVGKDCKREDIWRNKFYPKYKATRNNNDNDKGDEFMGAPFFKMAYDLELFQKGGAKAILKHPHLEADDCIAISVKYLINKYPDCNIYIITSDRDYLQLSNTNVHLYNLSFKNIVDKSSIGNPKDDLEIKIIMGDISDNIPSVFPKCGPKTAKKCIDDPELFKKKMGDNNAYYAQYELNKILVDFNKIPQELVDEFMSTIKK